MIYNDDMKKQVGILQIKPRKEYTLMEITELKLIPWAHNWRTIRRILVAGTLLSRVEKEGELMHYFVRGSEIKKYLIKYGPAMMGTVRKPKQIYGKRKSTGSRKEKTR